jgi:hypothetical protein
MNKICLPEIPKTWLIAILMLGLMFLRYLDIDTFVTAGMSGVIFYLFGVKSEQSRVR